MLALAWYVITLLTSSCVLGLFVLEVFSKLGLAPDYPTALSLMVLVSTGYAGIQLAFVAFIMLLFPFRGSMFFVMESFSHAAILFLLPYFLSWEISFSHPFLQKTAPMIYFVVFFVAHSAIKLFSFFAALQSVSGKRLWAMGWALASASFFIGAKYASGLWLENLQNKRQIVLPEEKVYQVGTELAFAKEIPEGAAFSFSIDDFPERTLTMRWAVPSSFSSSENPSSDQIFLFLSFKGNAQKRFSVPLRLRKNGWTEFIISSEELEPEFDQCTLWWGLQKDPLWFSILGISPITKGDKVALLSGPFVHRKSQRKDSPPNLIIIGADGLSLNALSRFGNKQIKTRYLDQFSQSALTFQMAYTPAPQAVAAYMSLLTGLNPLIHGFLQNHQGPLPKEFRTLPEVLQDYHYTTAAFTEGDFKKDLIWGKGWERGFEIFDSAIDPQHLTISDSGPSAKQTQKDEIRVPFVSSKATLQKALRWIEDNVSNCFAVFIRLQELSALEKRMEQEFPKAGTDKSTLNIYFKSLMDLDMNIGMFLKDLRDLEIMDNTIVVLLSPYGVSFERKHRQADMYPELAEEILNVPVIVQGPNIFPSLRDDLVALEDLACSLAMLIGVQFQESCSGKNFLVGRIQSLPISMWGDPLVLTIRDSRRRLFWQTGYTPFENSILSSSEPPRLFDISRYPRTGYTVDITARNAEIVIQWKKILEDLWNTHKEKWVSHQNP